ncbi:hypothetical protein [uncultured Bacteroides sp.]|uniref:hypothetical protein n=1 Tax=uncultured Bacteroides sp. TaxID=162156 RepID=UPI00262F92D7|nr:hypothetical protein [uncultured Bacteroides sp.]
MKGELYINGKDAYDTWGISMADTSLSALMTPAPNKEYIENKSRLEHGKRVITENVKVDERSLSLEIHLTATHKDQFFERYLSFCEELKKGALEIKTSYQKDVIYRMIYKSCSQFSQFMQGIGKFTLKLEEFNPENRKSQ